MTGKLLGALALLLISSPAWGQGGPPLQTDDPGTPGNGNFEINLGLTADRARDARSYETPIVDVNYGLGDRIQLKFEIPYVLLDAAGKSREAGLGNSLLGVKWRYFQDGKLGLNASTYPAFEWNNPTASVRRGLVDKGPNFFVPLEVTKTVGPVTLNGEAGHWFNSHDTDGNILGLAAGHHPAETLELLAEVYHQTHARGTDRNTTFGLGGRWEFTHGLLLLFMAGRSFHGPASGESQFIGYLGLQIQIERGTQRAE